MYSKLEGWRHRKAGDLPAFVLRICGYKLSINTAKQEEYMKQNNGRKKWLLKHFELI